MAFLDAFIGEVSRQGRDYLDTRRRREIEDEERRRREQEAALRMALLGQQVARTEAQNIDSGIYTGEMPSPLAEGIAGLSKYWQRPVPTPVEQPRPDLAALATETADYAPLPSGGYIRRSETERGRQEREREKREREIGEIARDLGMDDWMTRYYQSNPDAFGDVVDDRRKLEYEEDLKERDLGSYYESPSQRNYSDAQTRLRENDERRRLLEEAEGNAAVWARNNVPPEQISVFLRGSHPDLSPGDANRIAVEAASKYGGKEESGAEAGISDFDKDVERELMSGKSAEQILNELWAAGAPEELIRRAEQVLGNLTEGI